MIQYKRRGVDERGWVWVGSIIILGKKSCIIKRRGLGFDSLPPLFTSLTAMAKSAALRAVLPPDLDVRSHTLLASLWSNYGHIYRLTLGGAPSTLILKLIQPPPVSASASESHLRKLLSYRVERYFYAHLSAQLPPSLARVARCYPVAAPSALLIEDLSPAFPASHSSSDPHIVLHWLANFHATFWGTDPPLISPSPAATAADGVWPNGGYWYLATRRSEFAAISDDESNAYLVPFAERVSARLQRRENTGTTLMHGDCKSANIVFAQTAPACALYDFQYVGRGLGVQDVVYFLATSVARGRLRGDGERELLKVYYDEVGAALLRRGVRDEAYTWEVMLCQWEWALVDWMRFMAGWGCWGNVDWVEGRAKAICKRWEEEGCDL